MRPWPLSSLRFALKQSQTQHTLSVNSVRRASKQKNCCRQDGCSAPERTSSPRRACCPPHAVPSRCHMTPMLRTSAAQGAGSSAGASAAGSAMPDIIFSRLEVSDSRNSVLFSSATSFRSTMNSFAICRRICRHTRQEPCLFMNKWWQALVGVGLRVSTHVCVHKQAGCGAECRA